MTGAASRLAGRVTCNVVESINIGTRTPGPAGPLKPTIDELPKPLPFNVTVIVPEPAAAIFGEIECNTCSPDCAAAELDMNNEVETNNGIRCAEAIRANTVDLPAAT